MKIKQYPEFSEDYPAIDGIAKGERPSKEEREKMGERVCFIPSEKPIRSDIEEILKMDNNSFDSWYRSKAHGILGLLNYTRLIVKIPDLRHGSESAKHGLDANLTLRNLHETLERGLKYLEVIKKVRSEQGQD